MPYRKTHWFIPNKRKTQLHGKYPELKFILCTGQLQGPKFCTCCSGHRLWPKCRFGAGNKTLSAKTCTSPPTFQIIPKSCDLMLISHVCFLHYWAGCSQGIMEIAFMAPVRLKFPFNRTHSGWQVPDSLATAFRSKNKAKPNFILEIAKRYVTYLN
jgi:hypothetical protein